jgi:hypothetical protein
MKASVKESMQAIARAAIAALSELSFASQSRDSSSVIVFRIQLSSRYIVDDICAYVELPNLADRVRPDVGNDGQRNPGSAEWASISLTPELSPVALLSSGARQRLQ